MNKKAIYGKVAMLILFVVLIIVLVYFMFFNSKPTEISYSRGSVENAENQGLVQMIESGKIGALYIEYSLRGFY